VCQRPLLVAAAKGYEAVLGTGNNGRTPLWWAVVAEHDAIVKLLLGRNKMLTQDGNFMSVKEMLKIRKKTCQTG
jgi:hypothetical protein